MLFIGSGNRKNAETGAILERNAQLRCGVYLLSVVHPFETGIQNPEGPIFMALSP
jgi:hypothetical protein